MNLIPAGDPFTPQSPKLQQQILDPHYLKQLNGN